MDNQKNYLIMPFFLKLLSTEYSLLDQKLNDLRKFHIFFIFKISYQKKYIVLFIAYINANIIQQFLFYQKNLLLLCKTL